MNQNKKENGKLFFLADAWMIPLSLFSAIYFFAKGNTVFGIILGVIFVGSVAKLCRWAIERKKK